MGAYDPLSTVRERRLARRAVALAAALLASTLLAGPAAGAFFAYAPFARLAPVADGGEAIAVTVTPRYVDPTAFGNSACPPTVLPTSVSTPLDTPETKAVHDLLPKTSLCFEVKVTGLGSDVFRITVTPPVDVALEPIQPLPLESAAWAPPFVNTLGQLEAHRLVPSSAATLYVDVGDDAAVWGADNTTLEWTVRLHRSAGANNFDLDSARDETFRVPVTTDLFPPAAVFEMLPALPTGAGGHYLVTPTFSWTASDPTSTVHARCDITEPGGSVETLTKDGAPGEVVVVTRALKEGDSTVACSVADGAAHKVAESRTVKVDLTPPALAITPLAAGWHTVAPVVTITTTDPPYGRPATAYRVAATAEALADATPVAFTADTFTPAGLAPGPNFLRVTATDAAGLATSADVSFLFDDVLPVATYTLTGPAGNAPWLVGNATVTLACADATSGCEAVSWRIGDGATSDYAAPIVIATQGVSTLHYRARDTAGNLGAAESLVIKIDADLPTVVATLDRVPDFGEWFTDDVTVTLAGADGAAGSGSALVEHALGDAALAAYEAPFALATDGVHTVRHRATDVAGNVGETTATVVRLDATPPVTTLDAPALGATGWLNAVTLATLGATDATSGVDAIWFAVDGGARTWNVTVVPLDLAGEHVVTFGSVDVAGHEHASSYTYRLDTTAPSTTLTAPAPTGEAGWYLAATTATLAATDPTSGVWAKWFAVDDGARVWNTTDVPLDLAGTHTVTFGSVNVAGLEHQDAFTYKLDLDVPTATLDAPTPAASGWLLAPGFATVVGVDATSGIASSWYEVDDAPRVWEATVPLDLAGEHTVTFGVVDAAGRESAVGTFTFKLDATPPVGVVALDGEEGEGGWFLGDVTVTLSSTDAGSGPAGIRYAVDGGEPVDYTEPFVVSGSLAHTLDAWFEDEAGHVHAILGSPVDVDTDAPTTAITLDPAPAEGGWTTAAVRFLVAVSDATSGPDAAEYCLAACDEASSWVPYEAPVEVTANGEHVVKARGTDAAGRVSAVASATFRVDGALPTLELALDPTPDFAGSFALEPVTLTLAADDAASGVASLDICLAACEDEASWVAYEDPILFADDGDYEVRARARDVAGNLATLGPVAFSVDATPPALADLAPVTGWAREPVTLAYAPLADAVGFSHVLWTVTTTPHGAEAPATVVNGTTAELSFAPPLLAGDNVVTLVPVDLAGREGAAVVAADVSYDATAPDVTAVAPSGWTREATVTFADAAPAGAPVSVHYAVGPAAVEVDATFPVASPSILVDAPEGALVLSYVAFDAAGNAGPVRTAALLVDRTAPASTATVAPAAVVAGPATVTFALAPEGADASPSRIQYSVNAPLTAGSPTAPASLTFTTDGVRVIRYRAVDAAGNAEDAKSLTVAVDLTGPTVELVLDAIGDVARPVRAEATARDRDVAVTLLTLQVRQVVGGAEKGWTTLRTASSDALATDFQFGPGLYELRAIGVDAFGHEGESNYVRIAFRAATTGSTPPPPAPAPAPAPTPTPTPTPAPAADTAAPHIALALPPGGLGERGDLYLQPVTVTFEVADAADPAPSVSVLVCAPTCAEREAFDLAFDASGDYRVEVRAVDAAGNVATQAITFRVDVDAPVAAIASATTAPPGEASVVAAIDLARDDVMYAWSFGDGGEATGPKAAHAYAAAGTYAVTLTVTDAYGRASVAERAVTVEAPEPTEPVEGTAPPTPIEGTSKDPTPAPAAKKGIPTPGALLALAVLALAALARRGRPGAGNKA